MDYELFLQRRMHKEDIKRMVDELNTLPTSRLQIFSLIYAADLRVSINAMWCLASLPKSRRAWLYERQDELIDCLMKSSHPSHKRILLQILRDAPYAQESIRTDFLDYCLSKINSECEPVGIRSFCIYCAYNMCRFYPELVEELTHHLDLLSSQELLPGLRCALRNTRQDIERRPH